MTEFTKSDSASIAEFAKATRTPLIYEMVAAVNIGDKLKKGWMPLSPFIAMVPPDFQDDEMRGGK